MINIIYLVFAGLVSGVIGGMGMGGGTLLIPILSIFLGFAQKSAQGINLLVFIPMSIVALIVHIKNKLVDFKQTWALTIIGCLFSLIGALVANSVDNSVLKKMFAIFLIGLAIWQFIELIKSKQ